MIGFVMLNWVIAKVLRLMVGKTQKCNPLEKLRGSVTSYIGPLEPLGEGDWEALQY